MRHLRWRQVDLLNGQIIVGKSKTAAGEGRVIPLSTAAVACLTEWRGQFPAAQAGDCVFPSEQYRQHDGQMQVYRTTPTQPIGSWKTAWRTCRKLAGVSARWHDLRHTFISMLAESGAASDSTIMSMAGHVSRSMLQRYSHIGTAAKRTAIAAAFDGKILHGHQNGNQNLLGENANSHKLLN
ncbi:MAG: tyrosine-type recombinase/integrase [Terracidiphilus sp.]